ncbi:6-bladed beta-propeller [Belliella kenyensis]|uniref:6-bladed beta-propeller n=2 Tax=Belliella kenyensis TaxID=1472724 RepID=A0ABV8ENG3_9BACT|nr:6-bladed beta-propeller [Belliella kenyensis]MCH7402026.1 6-bladed beta-propeller [Belliella kenyensis]
MLANLFLLSCDRSRASLEKVYYDQEGFVVFDIVDHNEVDMIYFSEFVNAIDYIPLETSAACLIGEVDKVLINENFIYVLDKRIVNAAFVFDREGNFVKQLGREGEAEGEYLELGDMFFIDESQIAIYDHVRQQMLVFKDLEYSHTEKFDWKSSKIYEFGGYFYHNPFLSKYNVVEAGPFELFISGYESNIIEKHFEYPSYRDVVYEKQNVFRLYDDSVLFIPPFYNKVFSLKGKDVTPRYLFNFGDRQLPIEETYSFETLSAALQNYGHVGDTFLENQQHVFFEASYKGPSAKFCLYNKEEGVFKFSSKITNDVNHLMLYKFDDFNDAYAYGTLNAADFITAISKRKGVENQVLSNLRIEALDRSDNPVVAIYHFE